MNRVVLLVLAAGGVHVATGAGAGAEEINLTGTWEGSYTCVGTFDGEPFTETLEFETLVIQSGDRIRLEYDDEGGVGSVYQGVVRPVEPGGSFLSGIVQACGGDYPFEELIRLKNAFTFEEDEGFTGSMDGDSIFVTNDFPGLEGSLEIDTCVYGFNRISTEAPEVTRCAIRTRLDSFLD